MKYVIIEDETPAQHLIEDLLSELRPQWQKAACLDSVETAIQWLNQNPHPDITFMDIQLSDGIGFDILEKVDIQGLIVFTTAYDQYAIQAFKVNSIDYLLKPIKKAEMAEALNKFERYCNQSGINPNKGIDALELANALRQAKTHYRSRFLISQGEQFFPLPVSEVAYIFSRHRISSAVTFAGKRFVLDFTLDKLEEQLNPETFFRVSRQFIVNIDAVHKVHTFFNGKLILETQPAFAEKITISREKARLFKDWLDG